MATWSVWVGDCRVRLGELGDGSVDSVVCDPPYELGFMGKSWDASGVAYDVGLWGEVLRVLKPGGHLLAFGGSRTYHRLACAVEDAGFEIRDQIMWVYGSGFPKSLNVGKQDGCEDWQGWGTALKPAHEPIVVARKPLVGTVAGNVLAYGTGALNIDGCRVETDEIISNHSRGSESAISKGKYGDSKPQETHQTSGQLLGRWPANLIHDGSDEVLELFPSAARFFYCAKTSKKDRNEGLDGMPEKRPDQRSKTGMGTFDEKGVAKQANHHPTVKPTELMRYLVRLVTPLNGLVLDPFCGSGSTGKAAVLEGFRFLGIEQDTEYAAIAEARIRHANDGR